MNHSSAGFGEGDSENSFGDHQNVSEGGQEGALGQIQAATPNPAVMEENKNIHNDSSDTANFIHDSQQEIEQQQNANLSFDNESAIGTINPIHLNSGIENQNSPAESSHSGNTASNTDDLIYQTPYPRLQDLFRNYISTNVSWLPPHETIPRVPISQEDEQSEELSGRHGFEGEVEEALDEIVYLVNSEKKKYKESKASHYEQKISSERLFKEQKNAMEKEKEMWTENFKKVKGMFSAPEDVIHLNIGGTYKITVTKETLCKYENSNLASMFKDHQKLKKYKGRIFIDRNEKAFTLLVSFLRNGKPPLFENNQQEIAFYDELNYWKIPLAINKTEKLNLEEFDPNWCAATLHLETNNMIVRKHSKIFKLMI